MKVCILGSGAYGLALALNCYQNKNEVVVWTKLEQEKEEITRTGFYQKVLPNVLIPKEISITTDLSCVENSDVVILAIPISFFRSTVSELKNYNSKNLSYIVATKGIEQDSLQFPFEILKEELGTNQIGVLSGPTFAIDLATNSTAGLTLASNQDDIFKIGSELFPKSIFIEDSSDMIGVSVCGSIKNIMAILSGYVDSKQVSETTKALFLTKAILEIQKVILDLGGKEETISTLAGIGDILLTCNSQKSRNYTLGSILSCEDQKQIETYLQEHTTEGYYTLKAILPRLKEKNAPTPLIYFLDELLEGDNVTDIQKILTKKDDII